MKKWIMSASFVIAVLGGVWYWHSLRQVTHLEFEELPKGNEYETIARATGGQVWHSDKSKGAEGAMAMAANAIQSLKESQNYSLIWISEGRAPGNDTEIKFDVGSDIKLISVFVSGLQTRPSFRVFAPTGKSLTPDETLESDQSQTWLFKAPQIGHWKVKISSSDNVSVQIRGETDFWFPDPEPVRLGGRPGHEGYFPYKGILKAGAKEKISVEWPPQWSIREGWISLISLDGRVLSRNKLDAEVRIPSEPFRIRIEWEDQSGQVGQRMGLRTFESNRLELIEFRQRAAEKPNSEKCRRLQVSSHWSMLTDPKTAATVSVSCSIENFNGTDEWSLGINLLVPWDPTEKVTSTKLYSPDYQRLSPMECDLAKGMFLVYPEISRSPASQVARLSFSCEQEPAGLRGVLTVQVYSEAISSGR